MTSIQSKLDELASQNDNRTSVFDIQIQGTQNGTLTLAGRLLDESQLATLTHHFQDLKLSFAQLNGGLITYSHSQNSLKTTLLVYHKDAR